MPKPVRSWLVRKAKHSNLLPAYAVRAYVENDVQYCDVRNNDVAFSADRVQVAGYVSKPIKAPSTKWDGAIDPELHPLVIVAGFGENRGFVVLDTLKTPTALVQTQEESEYHSGDENVQDATATGRDVVIENGGTRVLVREDGKVIINSTGGVTIMANGSEVKVGDDNAQDAAAIAGPTADAIKELEDKVNAMQAWMRNFSIQLSLTLSGSAQEVFQTLQPFTAWTGADLAIDGEQLKSAILKLSSTSQSQG